MSAPERREAILQAAARLFEHYGYAKTTMADVAREAGVGVGTVYLEFDSKEAIVQELSGGAHARVLEAMRAAAATGAGRKRDAERLEAVLLARTECFLAARSKGQHACELLHHGAERPRQGKAEAVRAARQSFQKAEHALLEEIIRRGQESGSFGASDPSQTATLIQRAFASLSPPWIFAGAGSCGAPGAPVNDADDAERELAIAAQLCRLLLEGVLARTEPRAREARERGARDHERRATRARRSRAR